MHNRHGFCVVLCLALMLAFIRPLGAAEGHPDRTISLWFKPADTEGRQVLYAEGHVSLGFTLYLDGDSLYGGSWAGPRRQWSGHWLRHEGIEPARWYHAALVLEGTTTEVKEEKLHLYVDGERVDSGPGVRVPRSYAPPRVGRGDLYAGANVYPKYHDDNERRGEGRPFRGRMDDFRLINAALRHE